jgi:ligand-binding sensor domain-containing protein
MDNILLSSGIIQQIQQLFPGNIISDLLEDEQGILWIATTDGGLTKYDYHLPPAKQFKQFKHIDGDTNSIPVNIINRIVEDKFGQLWLATSGSYVLRFNRKTEKFESPINRGTRSVASLCIDENGILWVGRIGGSFLKINTATLEYEMDEHYDNLYGKLPHATITSLFRDTANYIWFGSWDNMLYRYNTKTNIEEAFIKDESNFSFPNDEVESFTEDSQGKMWMGGKYFGLTIYDRKEKKFFNYRYNPAQDGTIADNRVNYVYTDRSGMIWLGTSKGISVYNPAQQPFIQTFLPPQNKDVVIYDFYKNNDGSLWIGTSEGIFIQRKNENHFDLRKIFYKNEQLSVTKFFKDIDGSLYLGTNYSFFKYNSVANKVSLLPNTEKDTVMKRIIDSRIVSVMRDTIEQHPVLLVSPYGHYITYYDLIEKNGSAGRIQ